MPQETVGEFQTVRCPACGAEFVCRVQAGCSTCWCFELPKVCRVEEGTECLCPTCLQQKIGARGTDRMQER